MCPNNYVRGVNYEILEGELCLKPKSCPHQISTLIVVNNFLKSLGQDKCSVVVAVVLN